MRDRLDFFIDAMLHEARMNPRNDLASIIENAKHRLEAKDEYDVKLEEDAYNSIFDNYGSYS